MKRIVLCLVLLLFLVPISNPDEGVSREGFSPRLRETSLSESSGSLGIILVISLDGGAIPNYGNEVAQLLRERGIMAAESTVSDVITDPTLLSGSLVILDGSLGSENGTLVTDTFVTLLRRLHVPCVTLGRAAWLHSRIRESESASVTALLHTTLEASSDHSSAVFLSSPDSLSLGATLTWESVTLPVLDVQAAQGRVVNLTAGTSSGIAPLRYESYPLDLFLFGPENPDHWTEDGIGLLVNTVAYALSLGESEVALALASMQVLDEPVTGGFWYPHEPTVSGVYYAVRSASRLNTTFGDWASERAAKVTSILERFRENYDLETGFRDSYDKTVSLSATSMALWVISIMGIESQFDLPEIVTYITSRQDVGGGFQDSVLKTHLAVEALNWSGHLSSINTVALGTWLRACVVSGSDTSNPDYWGGVALNPDSAVPKTEYARAYLLSLACLGGVHDDPVKLTYWIQTRVSRGDGSYSNVVGGDVEILKGTTSALTTMAILDTLDTENKTEGLGWLAANQLDCGGFGISDAASDIIGKSAETAMVASCLYQLEEETSGTASRIPGYLKTIETENGFELLDRVPSGMWSYWTSRGLMHIDSGISSISALYDYASLLSGQIYPGWNNITAISSPEYDFYQYRQQSVWTHYFKAGTAQAIGYPLLGSEKSEIANYIVNCQHFSGHFRPTSFSGTAHMEHSVAAVETLDIIGALDSVTYLTALENAIMDEYESGSWATTGWSLRPFAMQQEAIDYLSTRAALRLQLVDEAMASEIHSTISARVQYEDLWALSRDVASVSLLVASGLLSFSDFSVFDTDLVLGALSSNFESGWLNATTEWQPAFTADVLEMVSILGLESRWLQPAGGSFSVSCPSTVELGEHLEITLSISPTASEHTVIVDAFGSMNQYLVESVDTLSINVPSDAGSLGIWNISLALWDQFVTRDFARLAVNVTSSLSGQLTLPETNYLVGDSINGTVSWTLVTGADAGQCDVIIRLGDPPVYEQWTHTRESPMDFSIPTTGIGAGDHNLTVTVRREFCTDLVFQRVVSVAEGIETYIDHLDHKTGEVGTQLSISFDLRFSSNDTEIVGQLVTIEITDSEDGVVHTDGLTTAAGTEQFLWTPDERGNYSYVLSFERNGTLMSSSSQGEIRVEQATELYWIGSDTQTQYETATFILLLTTDNGEPLTGMDLDITIDDPLGSRVMDIMLTTNATGHAEVQLSLDLNGNYTLCALFSGSSLLQPTSALTEVISFSLTRLSLDGIPSASLVEEPMQIDLLLCDSNGTPIQGENVVLRIVLLPSTTLLEEILVTDTSGQVSWYWSPPSPGTYEVSAEYAGTQSLAPSYNVTSTDAYISVSLAVDVPYAEVGESSTVTVTAVDHQGQPISGLAIRIALYDPLGSPELVVEDVTEDGAFAVVWTPLSRGQYQIHVNSSRQDVYEAATVSEPISVFEQTTLTLSWASDLLAIAPNILTVTISDTRNIGVSGVQFQVLVSIASNTLLDSTNTTDINGQVIFDIVLDNVGDISIVVIVDDQGFVLGLNYENHSTVLGLTDLTLATSPTPITQCSSLGIQATLLDWNGQPILGAAVRFTVTHPNGTIVRNTTRTTGTGGACSIAHTFESVGDYLVGASYAGEGLNAGDAVTNVQRVRVTPDLLLLHDTTAHLGEAFAIHVGLLDASGAYIAGRDLAISISLAGEVVFEAGRVSSDGLLTLSWTPDFRGSAIVALTHAGDVYYLYNSTSSTTSVMETVSGSLGTSRSTMNLFDTITLHYFLSAQAPEGITITFEVLGTDLVPVWSETATTNATGYTEVSYTAQENHGFFTVRATPSDDFMLGGASQSSIAVMTEGVLSVDTVSPPPVVTSEVNMTISIENKLGLPVSDISVRVTVTDPYGVLLKLGSYYNWISVPIGEGGGTFVFSPQHAGLHEIGISYEGSNTVYEFDESRDLIVYAATQLTVVEHSAELEVGEVFDTILQLVDYAGHPLVGKEVAAELHGLERSYFVVLTTNETGHVTWSKQLTSQGVWTLDATFAGLGVYLSSDVEADVNVRYGTEITVTWDGAEVVAGLVPLNVSVLLSDSGGNPLEGRTIRYEVYHVTGGLVDSGSVIQHSVEAETIIILIERIGLYTVIFHFAGTEHYHPSSTGIDDLFVLGQANPHCEAPQTIDRAENENISITIMDEVGEELNASLLDSSIELIGPDGELSLQERLSCNGSFLITLQGLPVGNYTLSVIVHNSLTRVGNSASLTLAITSESLLQLIDTDANGIVNNQQMLRILLEDSMHEAINGPVWISVYDPDGDEVYGGFMRTRTRIELNDGQATLSFTPRSVGNYSILLEYEGELFVSGALLSFDLLIRHESSLDVVLPQRVTYIQGGTISVHVRAGLKDVANELVTVRFLCDSSLVRSNSFETNRRGQIQVPIELLPAAAYSVEILYGGSDRNAPVQFNGSVVIEPVVTMALQNTNPPDVGYNWSGEVVTLVEGTTPDWKGTLRVTLYGPDGGCLKDWTALVSSSSTLDLWFQFESEGPHILNITLQGVPVLFNISRAFVVAVSSPSFKIPMDASTMPVIGGGAIMGLVALIVKKRLASLSLPGEWDG